MNRKPLLLYLAPLSPRKKKKGWKEMFYLPGWAFYSAVIGVGLTFICAVISGQAEKSTASDKVQDKMNEGKTLICLAWNEKNWGNCISSSRSMPFLEYPHHDFLCQKSENAKLYSFLSDPLDERTKGKKKKKKRGNLSRNQIEVYRGSRSVILLHGVIKFLLGRRVLLIPEMNLCQLNSSPDFLSKYSIVVVSR